MFDPGKKRDPEGEYAWMELWDDWGLFLLMVGSVRMLVRQDYIDFGCMMHSHGELFDELDEVGNIRGGFFVRGEGGLTYYEPFKIDIETEPGWALVQILVPPFPLYRLKEVPVSSVDPIVVPWTMSLMGKSWKDCRARMEEQDTWHLRADGTHMEETLDEPDSEG